MQDSWKRKRLTSVYLDKFAPIFQTVKIQKSIGTCKTKSRETIYLLQADIRRSNAIDRMILRMKIAAKKIQ